jgi:transglutaminase/protease-like cytokinesis protein 3
MPQDASTFMKYFYLAQELCARAEYDYENEQVGNATPYSALISGKTICQGYARAYQALCQEAGLSCREVTGSSEGVAHAWNIVELERDTYYVDLTWADERGEPGTPEWLQYFMLTQDEILFDHQIDDGSVATGGPLGLI